MNERGKVIGDYSRELWSVFGWLNHDTYQITKLQLKASSTPQLPPSSSSLIFRD
jgi:hypothetical protein